MRSAFKRKGEWLELTLPESSDEMADPKVAEALGVPPKLWQRLLRDKEVVRSGSRIRLRLFPDKAFGFEPEFGDVDILYEDEFCLVANKPAGMPVHPTEPGQGGTLANAVAWHYVSTGQEVAVRHIHRLDADTTGPVLYAKNELALLKMDEAMRCKAIGRTYVAIVQGRLAQQQGVIDQPIGRDRHHPSRRRVSQGGDPAITHYETLERFREATLVRLTLETGRTHQIRVHMSYIGHPLLGDALYGGPITLFGRQALHGERLVFPHPFGLDAVNVEAPWPEDLLALADKLSRL